MIPTNHFTQVAETQPDADDSSVPISRLAKMVGFTQTPFCKVGNVGAGVTDKQGGHPRLYINRSREALASLSQPTRALHTNWASAGLAWPGAMTTSCTSDPVWPLGLPLYRSPLFSQPTRQAPGC
ncbi:MAG: hypothetical protein M3Q45_13595 [Chloroflexota bacterium]|nr:hypothetical protein [Chloroflexota bacterium]